MGLWGYFVFFSGRTGVHGPRLHEGFSQAAVRPLVSGSSSRSRERKVVVVLVICFERVRLPRLGHGPPVLWGGTFVIICGWSSYGDFLERLVIG